MVGNYRLVQLNSHLSNLSFEAFNCLSWCLDVHFQSEKSSQKVAKATLSVIE